MAHPARLRALAISPDGTTLACGYHDGVARLWDAVIGKPLGPPRTQHSPVLGVAFTPDGRSFFSATADGTTQAWPVPTPVAGSVEQLRLQLEVLTGMRLTERQSYDSLPPDVFEQRRFLLNRQPQASREGLLVGDPGWPNQGAQDAEEDGDTLGALWHLTASSRRAGKVRGHRRPGCCTPGGSGCMRWPLGSAWPRQITTALNSSARRGGCMTGTGTVSWIV